MTKKYHEELEHLSNVLNKGSYSCGSCDECNTAYSEFMKIINKIPKTKIRTVTKADSNISYKELVRQLRMLNPKITVERAIEFHNEYNDVYQEKNDA